jgi:hypothetical protein
MTRKQNVLDWIIGLTAFVCLIGALYFAFRP